MKRVLVIDDDKLNATMIRSILKDQYEVVYAENGRLGLAAVEESAPDLIVLDVQMPEMSGFEFVNKLAMLPGGKAIPVIIYTGSVDMQDLFYFDGVVGYYNKPMDVDKLEAKIKECLG